MEIENFGSFLSIIILNWNSPQDTKECVDSLLPQIKPGYKIIIVDNGSLDNSVNLLRKQFPSIEIIENENNLGFQGGMNVGIKKALQTGSEYIMLLNNDTVADQNMLELLFKNFPVDASLVSPLLCYYDMPSKIWSTGGKINPIILEISVSTKKIRFNDPVFEQEFIPSCAWLVKSELFTKIGLLDEILYYDDLDFCLRTRRNGFKMFFVTQAILWHKVSQSMGGQYNVNERFLMARNSGYYFRKHAKFWQLPIIFVYRIISAFLWTIRLMVKKNYKAISAYWKGFKIGWFDNMPVKKSLDF